MAIHHALAWSHYSLYRSCPQQLLWRYGWPGIDVGAGPGRRKPLPIVPDRTHAIMGQAIQKVVEVAHEKSLFSKVTNPQTLVQIMESLAEHALHDHYTKQHRLPHSEQAYEDMKQVCRQGAAGYVSTLFAHKLHTVPMECEVSLKAKVDGVPIQGRLDFVVPPEHGGMVLDGKNSKSKDYVHGDQLRWYALLFKGAYGELPKKLGFVWFRYPHSEDTGEEGISWVSLRKADMTKLQSKIKRVHLQIHGQQFQPTPSIESCRFCDYHSVCPDADPLTGDMPEDPVPV